MDEEWKKFRDSGLLWWVNRSLHLFGWAIIFEIDNDNGEIRNVYPRKVSYRGFGESIEEDGFKKLSAYLAEHGQELKEQTKNGGF